MPKYVKGGENAPPQTSAQQKQATIAANAQLMCVAQPNSDGTTLTVDVQKGAIGTASLIATGSLPIQTTKTGSPAEGFRTGEFIAEGQLNAPKTGAPAGQVAIAGEGMDTDYSCLYKGPEPGAQVQSAQLLTKAPSLPGPAPK